eukprot:PhM_4_TR14127/c1_g1_i3/m.90876/K05791/terZ; tellurium resistance protein TerZ
MVSIHCYNEGTFADCCSITTRLTDLTENRIVDKHDADYTAAQSSLLLYVVQRRDATYWDVAACSVSLPGHTFMDGYGAMLHHVRPDLAGGRVAEGRFNLRKNDDFVIPQNINHLRVGLGWDTRCDLDASVVMLRRDATVKELVYFGNTKSSCLGVVHAGDNLTGEGDGDDEQITLRLDRIPADVFCLVVTVNVYTANKTFCDVDGEFCRLVDVSGAVERELFHYPTLDNGVANGILFCSIYRDYTKPPGWWKAQAIGQWVPGRKAKEIERWAMLYTSRLFGAAHVPPEILSIPPPPPVPQAPKKSQQGGGGAAARPPPPPHGGHVPVAHNTEPVPRSTQEKSSGSCCLVS